MGLQRVTGNNKQTQHLVDVEIASAVKASNQSNPRSGGTTLVSQPQIYDPLNKVFPTDQSAVTSLRTNSSNGNAWVSSVSGQTSGIDTLPQSTDTNSPQTIAILPESHKPAGNYLPRERVLAPGITRAVSASQSQHPWYATGLEMDGGTNQANSMREISEQLTLPQFQTTTCSLGDFLVNLSQLLASGEDSQTFEALCSLKSVESLGLAELSIYSLRTSKDCLITRAGLHFKPLSQRWMNWGMTVNGRCLTAKTTECRRIGSGCSLSQILEPNPDPKYFLSEKQVKSLTDGMQKSQIVCNHLDTPAETTEE